MNIRYPIYEGVYRILTMVLYFSHSIKDTATTSGGCVAVFCGQHFYAALSGLRCLVFQPYTAATYG